MSRMIIALTGLATAIGAAVAFPHQPVPTSFRDRITDAVKAVQDAADGGESFGGDLDATGALADLDGLVEAVLAKIERPPPVAVDDIVAGLLAKPDFADAIAAKVAANKAGQGELAKLVAKQLGEGVSSATEALAKRVEDLEQFAGKVDGDLGPRLTALEEAAIASSAGAA